ncbi:MAG: GNAT family N-acetyltransferase [Bacteroidota bacterium]
MITDRLHLRDITEADTRDIHTSNSFPEVAQYNTIGIPTSIDVTRQQLQRIIKDAKRAERQHYGWTIRLINTDTFVGEIGMKVGTKNIRKQKSTIVCIPITGAVAMRQRRFKLS